MARENWFLDIVRRGFHPTHESNTSKYLYEVLRFCLGWPIQRVQPQISRRGVVDYELDTAGLPVRAVGRPPDKITVEVKRLGARLNDSHIHKYLVVPGRSISSFRLGILTNFNEWRVYISGVAVKQLTGRRMICLASISIKKRSDIAHLSRLVGFRSNGNFSQIRAALGHSDEVIVCLLKSNTEVLRAFRHELEHRTV